MNLTTSINTLTVTPAATKTKTPVTKLNAKRSCLSYEEAYQRYMRNKNLVSAGVVGACNPSTYEQESAVFHLFTRNYEVISSTQNVYADYNNERYTDEVQSIIRTYGLSFRDIEKAESIDDYIAGSFMEFKGEYEQQINKASKASGGSLEIMPSGTAFLDFANDCEMFAEYERYRKYHRKDGVTPAVKWKKAINWNVTIGKIRIYKFR